MWTVPARSVASTLCAAWWVLCASPSRADDVAASVVLASDKVFRGVSQSGGHPALLADVSGRTDSGWSADLGVATLAPGAEWTASLSRSLQLDHASLQIGAQHYGDSGARRQQRYDELFASVVWDGRILGSVAASPNVRYASGPYPARSGWAVAYELGWREPLAASLAVDVGIGYFDLRRVAPAGYVYGSVDLGWRIAAGLQLHVTRVASNAAARGLVPTAIAGPRWIGSLAWAF